ncbi:MAG: hypothetical protein ACR2NA_03850 [Solirubrobacterales bacterium]
MGVALGAIWATGFASVTGSGANEASSEDLSFASPPASSASSSGSSAAASAEDAFEVEWKGRDGKIAADQKFFHIDLDGETAADEFFVEVAQSNDTSDTGWTVLQLKVELVATTAANCSAVDLSGTGTTRVLNMDTQGAFVSFSSLAGGTNYCVGIESIGLANNTNGTFLKREDKASGTPSVYPAFQAIVGQSG